jgi:zinc-ribbon domain
MKKGLKWLLGILVGLMIVAVLVGVGTLVINRWHNDGFGMANRSYRFSDNEQNWNFRNMPGVIPPRMGNPIRPFGGTTLNRSGGFRLLPMLFGCFIFAGFLILIVLGLVFLLGGRRQPQPSVAPSTPAAAPAAAASVQATTGHPCPHCGQIVKEDWKHCPYCGGPLTAQAENVPPASQI